MAFHDVELPTKFFGFGSSFGPQHDTLIAPARNGYESRVSNWRHARRQFDVNNKVIQDVDLRELQEFVLAREGSLHSFKITDPMDFTTAANPVSAHAWDDVRIGTGDGTTTIFWLVKRYNGLGTNGQYELTRRLHRTNGVLSGIDSTQKSEGTDFTVGSNGSIDYDSAPARGEGVFAGCSFFTEVRFKLDLDDWLKNSLDDFNAGSISAPMIEEKVSTNLAHDREILDLGYSHSSTVGTVQLEFQQGLFHFITPSAAMTARLPDLHGGDGEVGYETAAGQFRQGGPYFVVFNLGTFDITFQQLNTAGTWANVGANAVISAKRARKFWISGEPDEVWRVY